MAIDMAIAERAEVFVGNGVSVFCSLERRLAEPFY
jgi:hypothetical protein